MIAKILLLAFIVAIPSVTGLTQTAAPDSTVRAFYAYSNARSATFNRRHIELRKKWYSAALYQAFLKQLAKDEAHLKSHPTEKPFFGDGLDFRPLDENCEVGERTYKRVQSIQRSQMTTTRAEVEVKFAYPSACTSGGDPIIYKVKLRKLSGRWLIDDWTYDDGSSLVESMKAQRF